MKTKHLLTALALPAIFAACTADDIVTEGASQAQRVALNENFKLNFGGVESRLSAGKPGEAFKFDFEEGDLVGGAIIDQYTPSDNGILEDDYTVVDYVSANQPFKFDGSNWTIEHTMVEGKYLFYYPYNEANNSRGAAKYSVPVLQDLSDKITGKFNPKAAIEKYSMAVGYQFLSKDNLSASVELIPIFSYARLVMKLDNSYPGGEIDKVVLASNGNEFIVNGQIGNETLESYYNLKKTSEEFDWADYDETTDFAFNKTTSNIYDNKLDRTSPVIVGKVPAGTSMTKDAQNNHSFETYLVVPAQENLKDLTVYLYTTDGNIYSGVVANTFNGDFNRNTPKKVEVKLTKADVVPYVISSQSDWNASVDMMAKNEIAEFMIADADFALTNESKFPSTGAILVKDIAVAGNNVTIANVAAETITVNEGAKLIADVTLVADKIINKGEVVFNEIPESRTAEEVEVPETYWIEAIENEGILTINKNAVLTWYETVYTDDEEPVVEAYNEKGLLLTNKKEAVVTVAGTLSVYGTNEGTINNSGTIYVVKGDAAGTEKGVFGLENKAPETDTVDEELVVLNKPVINIAATGKLRADGTLTNNSLIVNEGILSCKNNEGKILNNGAATNKYTVAVVDAKAGSTTYITTNSANGKVIVYSMLQEDLSIDTQSGDVEYTATADVVLDGSKVTNLIINKTTKITWSDATTYTSYALNYLEVTANATVEMVVPTGKSKTISEVNVTGGKLTLGSDLSVSTLKVAEGASVSVPAAKTLTVATTGGVLTNEGTISVVGTLTAEGILAADAGDVEDNGKGTLNWKKTAGQVAIDNAKAAFEAELLKALKHWIVSADPYGFHNFKNDLYNTTDTYQNCKGTAKLFNAYVNGNNTGTLSQIQQLLENYNKLVEESKQTSIEGSYNTVAAAYLKEITDSDEYEEFIEDFEITVPPTSNNFFADTKSGTTTTTAATHALNKFKSHVNAMTIQDVPVAYKQVLCSITSYDTAKAYVPDYTFVFTTSNVYKLYNEIILNYAATGKFSKSVTYNGVSYNLNVNYNSLSHLKTWVDIVANMKAENGTVADLKAKTYVLTEDTNGNTIWDESLEWAYTEKTIEAIISYINHDYQVVAGTGN